MSISEEGEVLHPSGSQNSQCPRAHARRAAGANSLASPEPTPERSRGPDLKSSAQFNGTYLEANVTYHSLTNSIKQKKDFQA